MVYIVILVGAYFLVVKLEGLSEGFEKEVFLVRLFMSMRSFMCPCLDASTT